MNRKNKTQIFKLILFIFVILIMVGITIYLMPVMKDLRTLEGQNAFKEKISETGIMGLLTLFGLQFAQIFLFIVPGEPIEILAGICYGGVWGTLFILISTAIISVFIYFLVHVLGRKFIYDFVDENKIEQIENSKVFQNPRTIEFIMFILFFIPGTPKDLLTYIGALLPIKPIKFILIATFARIPSVISSTIAGDNLLKGNWEFSILVYIITFIISIISVFIVRKLDKNKITEEAIKAISEDNK